MPGESTLHPVLWKKVSISALPSFFLPFAGMWLPVCTFLSVEEAPSLLPLQRAALCAVEGTEGTCDIALALQATKDQKLVSRQPLLVWY